MAFCHVCEITKTKHRKDDELRINRFGLITMFDCEKTENSEVVKVEKNLIYCK